MSFSKHNGNPPASDATRARWRNELERDRVESLMGERSAKFPGPGAAPAAAAVGKQAAAAATDPEERRKLQKQAAFQIVQWVPKAADVLTVSVAVIVTFVVEAIYLGLSIISTGAGPIYTLSELLSTLDKIGFVLWFIVKSLIVLALVLGMLAIIVLIVAAYKCYASFTCSISAIFSFF